MHIGKIIFTGSQQAAPLLKENKITTTDVSFFKFDQFVMLRLQTSKTDVNYIGVLIVLEPTHKQYCLVTSFGEFFSGNC